MILILKHIIKPYNFNIRLDLRKWRQPAWNVLAAHYQTLQELIAVQYLKLI